MNITVEERIKNTLSALSTVCYTCGKKGAADCGTCTAMANTYNDIIRLSGDFVKENAYIDRDIFRSVVSEHPPTIADDSQQPEWAQGELDKCLDHLMDERPIRII